MNMNDSTRMATGVTQERLAGLRKWNIGLTLLHFAQAVAIVLLAGSFAITVTSSLPEGPPGTAVPAPASLFDVPGGGLGVAWLDGRAMAPGLSVLSGSFSMALRAATYGPDRAQQTETLIDQRVCDCCPVSTAVTPDGVIVAFRDRSVDEIRDISVSRLVNGTWSDPMPVHRDNWKISACPVNGPSISAEGERVAVAWFSVEAGKGRTLAAFSTDAGRSFGSPVRVDEAEAAGRPQVVLLDDGAAAVSWVEFTDGRSQLKVRRIDGSGKRSPAATVAEGMGAQHPRLARAGHDLVVAWVERGRVVTARAVESRSSN